MPCPDTDAGETLDAEHWTPLTDAWERIGAVISPLTGVIPGVQFRESWSTAGRLARAATTGRPTTSWFSPVTGQAQGAAVKLDPLHALVAAGAEAFERYACAVYRPEDLVRGTYMELAPTAIDPRTYPLGSDQDYARSGDRLARFHPELSLEWAAGVSLTSGKPRLVPACMVYCPYRFPSRAERLVRPISTGLAAACTRSEAILAGLLEVIERDSFVIFWENRLPCPTIDLDRIPSVAPLPTLVWRLREAGLRLRVKLTTTDLAVPAMVVMAIDELDDPPVAFSARANLDPVVCLLRCLEELEQVRASVKAISAEKGIPESVESVRAMEDHFTFWARNDRLPLLSFIDDGPTVRLPPPSPRPARPWEAVQTLVAALDARGYEVIAFDLTPIDLAECGFRVLRVVVPGLQPVTFGLDFRHRGGRRLYQAPVAMGMRSQPAREEDLNPWPIPGG
jgi:thiazole/oxazole-forming peptide maturase SagD family component